MPNFLVRYSLYLVIKNFSKNFRGNLLDIGCGEKPYEHLFRVNSYEGCDLHGAESKADYLLHYDDTILPFKDNAYTNVVAFQSLYLFPDVDKSIKEIYRILKPKGFLLISVPFIWFDASNYNEQRFSLNHIKHMLTSNGFNINQTQKTDQDLVCFFALLNSFINAKIFSRKTGFNIFGIIQVPIIATLNFIGFILLKLKSKQPCSLY